MAPEAGDKATLQPADSSTPKKSPARNAGPGSGPASGTAGSLSRTRSVRTPGQMAAAARVAGKRASAKDEAGDDDLLAERAALVETLKDQLRQAEQTADQHQRQVQVLQAKLEDSGAEQMRLEQLAQRHEEQATAKSRELNDALAARQDLEKKLADEVASAGTDQKAAAAREAELNDVIARLKETLSQREAKRLTQSPSRQERVDLASPLPTPTLQSTDEAILQKDRVIEGLRLELADSELRIMEAGRAGTNQRQALEKELMELRMSNAKLIEETESWELLLQEKTLAGQLAHKFSPTEPERRTGGNLADELETVGEEDEDDGVARLERELREQREENRALTRYIEKILPKLAEAAGMGSTTFSNGSVQTGSPRPPSRDKELPRPPSGDEGKETFLQRAGSIFAARKVPRPPSYQGASLAVPVELAPEQDALAARQPSAHDDPETAPRVPLQRGASVRQPRHARAGSDTRAAAAPSSRRTSLQPPSLAQSPPRNASIDERPADADAAAATAPDTDLHSTVSAASDSGYGTASPPRSGAASTLDGAGGKAPATPSASTLAGSKHPRPLRLVQEKQDAEAEKKRASRQSWIGWFNKGAGGPGGPGPPTGTAGSAPPATQQGSMGYYGPPPPEK